MSAGVGITGSWAYNDAETKDRISRNVFFILLSFLSPTKVKQNYQTMEKTFILFSTVFYNLCNALDFRMLYSSSIGSAKFYKCRSDDKMRNLLSKSLVVPVSPNTFFRILGLAVEEYFSDFLRRNPISEGDISHNVSIQSLYSFSVSWDCMHSLL